VTWLKKLARLGIEHEPNRPYVVHDQRLLLLLEEVGDDREQVWVGESLPQSLHFL